MKRKYKSLIIFLSFKCESIINKFVENGSKQKTVDTAKLKKLNNNH